MLHQPVTSLVWDPMHPVSDNKCVMIRQKWQKEESRRYGQKRKRYLFVHNEPFRTRWFFQCRGHGCQSASWNVLVLFLFGTKAIEAIPHIAVWNGFLGHVNWAVHKSLHYLVGSRRTVVACIWGRWTNKNSQLNSLRYAVKRLYAKVLTQ